jgi:hypothetical protein
MGDDPVGKAGKRQRLEVDAPRSFEHGEKQSFAPKKHGPDIAGPFDIHRDAIGIADDATGIDVDFSALQFLSDDRATRMEERLSVAFEALHDESFPGEKSRAEPALEGNRHLRAHRGTEERPLFTGDRASVFQQIDRDDLPRIRGGESDPSYSLSSVREMRHEEGFPRQRPFSDFEQFSHESLIRLGTVSHFRFELHPVVHPVHHAGFGNDGFAGIELHFYGLDVVAEQLVIDFV